MVQMMNLEKPVFKNKQYGPAGGIPLLNSLWEKFDLSLLFLQTGIVKHSGVPSWLMAFAYVCGLIAQIPSVNQNADFSADSPLLKLLLKGKSINQSAFSRFFAKSFQWLKFAVGRMQHSRNTRNPSYPKEMSLPWMTLKLPTLSGKSCLSCAGSLTVPPKTYLVHEPYLHLCGFE